METRLQLRQAGFDFVDHGTAEEIVETRRNYERSGVEWEFRELVEDWFGIEVHILAVKRISKTKKQLLKELEK